MLRVFFLALLWLGGGSAAAQDLTNYYRLETSFDPHSGAMEVSGELAIIADRPRNEIDLLLNKALVVSSATYGDGEMAIIEQEVVIDGHALPRTQRLRLPLDRQLEKGESVIVRFEYAGRLTTDDIEIGRGIVTPAWSELTMEALWFPVLLDEPLLRSDVTLTLPENYQVAGPGKVERLAPGQWRLDPLGPVSGRITFIAAPHWSEARRQLNPALAASLLSIAPEPRAAAILEAVKGAYASFEGLLGAPQTLKTMITLVNANRDIGLKYPNQAYSTGGDFIVLDRSEPALQQDTLHHEIAHLWWSSGRPGTPDEFMSESVSEYLAMRRGEEVWGSEWLQGRRDKLSEESARVDARFRELDGFTPIRQPLLYFRGPSALWALHDRIGVAGMDALLRAAYDDRLDTLSKFELLVSTLEGTETAQWFADQL